MLIFIAPPSTELEENKVWLGNTSNKLSENGSIIAKDFAAHDMWIVPDRVYVAPATQAFEFLSIILPDLAHPILIDEFADRSMGSLTGRGYRETMEEFPRRNWLGWTRNFWTAPPEGESLFDISDRILTAFRTKIMPVTGKEKVLIIAAPDIIRILLGFLTKTEEVDVPKIDIQPVLPYVINGEIA